METKQCKTCQETKPVVKFYKNMNGKPFPNCMPCQSEIQRQRYHAKKKEKLSAFMVPVDPYSRFEVICEQ